MRYKTIFYIIGLNIKDNGYCIALFRSYLLLYCCLVVFLLSVITFTQALSSFATFALKPSA